MYPNTSLRLALYNSSKKIILSHKLENEAQSGWIFDKNFAEERVFHRGSSLISSEVYFQVILSRRFPNFTYYSTYIGLVHILFIAAFVLHTSSGEKITMWQTVLINYSVIALAIYNDIPDSPTGQEPILGYLLLIMMFVATVFTLEAAVVSNIYHHSKNKKINIFYRTLMRLICRKSDKQDQKQGCSCKSRSRRHHSREHPSDESVPLLSPSEGSVNTSHIQYQAISSLLDSFSQTDSSKADFQPVNSSHHEDGCYTEEEWHHLARVIDYIFTGLLFLEIIAFVIFLAVKY